MTYFLRQRRICETLTTLSLYPAYHSFVSFLMKTPLFSLFSVLSLWFTLISWCAGFSIVSFFALFLFSYDLCTLSSVFFLAFSRLKISIIAMAFTDVAFMCRCVRLFSFHLILTYLVLFAFRDTLAALETNTGQERAPSCALQECNRVVVTELGGG